ncbi:MAG: imidazole glycerol phosphate synthase subunit HisH [Candidatus Omnitrophica bacterium]|jgi:glutamine amidotransferase|nr:imidazole glycerol phosphate synthase subunit HisH [Candidatus Omnitrophota bacterium]
MIGIIDYNMGNIHSVNKAIQAMGEDTFVAVTAEGLDRCSKIILPGVGAFDDAMEELNKKGFTNPIKDLIAKGKIFLGICLGMQLLLEKSQEAKKNKGIGVIKGEVKKFSPSLGLKVPHMGWNNLKPLQNVCPLFKGLDHKAQVYFCHSYYACPDDKKVVASTTDYGVDFASVIWKDNIFGVQFHPEKSQEAGLIILKNFISL